MSETRARDTASVVEDVNVALASKPAKTFATTAPTSPATGDIWYDTDETPPVAQFWDGSAWQPFSTGVGDADFSNTATGTYTDGGGQSWKYISFTSSGTLTVTQEGYADILVVAGGGGGVWRASNASGAGGGGGGVVYATALLQSGSVTITVGGGGASSGDGNASSAGSDIKVGGGRRGYGLDVATAVGWGGGGATGGITGNPGDRRGGGAGGTVWGSNLHDGRSVSITGSAVTYGEARSSGNGTANTGQGGGIPSSGGTSTGGSGVVIIRVRT